MTERVNVGRWLTTTDPDRGNCRGSLKAGTGHRFKVRVEIGVDVVFTEGDEFLGGYVHSLT